MITRHTEDSTRRVESARKQFQELQKDIAQGQTLASTTAGTTNTRACSPPPLIPSTPPSQRPDGNITDSEPGTLPFETFDGSCFETFSTSLLNDDVIYDRTFPNRRVAYYGQFSYRYSGGFHPAREVPESSYLSEIIKVLKIRHPEINFNSVMVTSYDAPHSCIPPHSDNEASISRDSNIITLSLGSPREVVFRRKIPGEYKKVTFTATHASLYAMSRRSQDEWDHSVPATSVENFEGPRMSITFRLLEDPGPNKRNRRHQRGSMSPAPALSSPHQDHQTPQRHLRVLILSDSKNRTFDCSLLKEPIIAFREDLFHLRDLAQHQALIEQSDLVLISAGVNDLRYGRADPMTLHNHLKHFTSQFRTDFIFDAISPLNLSADPYFELNDRIDNLNELLLHLSLRSANFHLFDNLNFGLPHLARDGLHLNNSGKSIVSECWVDCILIRLGFRKGSLPLRHPFLDLYYDYMNSFSYGFG